MSDNEKRIYEGMFLFPQSSLSNMQEASDQIQGLLTRVEAEVVSFKKWDERRLAYEINGNKRGVYFLCYFNCDPTQIEVFERLCNQSESLLRCLVTRADHINQEEIEAADGRESLADEIKLREEQAASAKDSGDASSYVTVGGKTDADKEQESKKDAADPEPESKKSPADPEVSETPKKDAADPEPESKESPADAEVSETPKKDAADPEPESKESPADAEASETPEEDAADPEPESKEPPADAEASETPEEDAADPEPESKESPADAEAPETPEEDGDDQDKPAAEATAEA